MGKPIILELIPGFNEALREAERIEAEDRELPFLNAPITLCGFDVRHFTPNHRAILANARSPFIFGGLKTIGHVCAFLWVVSWGFDPKNQKARKAFISNCITLDYFDTVRDIDAYLEAAFRDRPDERGAGSSSPFVSFSASFVWAISTRFSRGEIMDMPFAEIFQYLRLAKSEEFARVGQKAKFGNRLSYKVRKEWMEKAIEEATKENG